MLPGEAFKVGDTIAIEGHLRWHWLVRAAAYLTRNKLPARRAEPREFVVSWTSDGAEQEGAR